MQPPCNFGAVSLFIVDFADFSIRSNRISGFSMFEFIYFIFFFFILLFMFEKLYMYRYPMPRAFSFCYYFWITSECCTFFNSVGLVGGWASIEYESLLFLSLGHSVNLNHGHFHFHINTYIDNKNNLLTLYYIFVSITLFLPHQFTKISNQQAIILFWSLVINGSLYKARARFTFYSIQNCNRILKWYKTSPKFESHWSMR